MTNLNQMTIDKAMTLDVNHFQVLPLTVVCSAQFISAMLHEHSHQY